MESTANLHLPYIMPSQAQKHVTHNEALALLDAVVQLSVRDRDLTEPAGAESEGDRYIVAAGATGPWEGWDGAVALWENGGWRRIEPKPGWLAWVEDEETLVRRTGDAWADLGNAFAALQGLSLLGVGTAADAANPFAAKLNKALWTARYDGEGGDGDLRYTLNKQAAAGVLSLLMQSDWSGRAEIGLIGDDDLSLKVSPDGSSWKEALRIDRATGAASFPHTAALAALAGLSGANGAFARFTGPSSAVMQAIVGTVSQSDGVPTGALVEAGANANGRYVRFADGTQLCATELTSNSPRTFAGAGTWANPYRTDVNAWTYPAPFAAAPVVAGDVLTPGAADAVARAGILCLGSAAGASAATQIQGFYLSDNAESLTPVFQLAALGRWF